jgi:ankyrin repeat protein
LIGRTPLVYAVVSENAAVVKYLLDHGADPNKVDDDGLAPLHSAAGIGLSNSLISLCIVFKAVRRVAAPDPLPDA